MLEQAKREERRAGQERARIERTLASRLQCHHRDLAKRMDEQKRVSVNQLRPALLPANVEVYQEFFRLAWQVQGSVNLQRDALDRWIAKRTQSPDERDRLLDLFYSLQFELQQIRAEQVDAATRR